MQRHMPLGYQIVDGKADIVPEAAQIVKAIFHAYLGGTSTCQIAKDLTAQSVLNASRNPSWNHGSVGKILENSKYIGDEFYPSLIDSETFKRVQTRRHERIKSLGRAAQLNSFQNQTLFSGKIYCGICGRQYLKYVEHCNQPGENVKWKCKQYIKSNRVYCRNAFLTDNHIENAFVDIINRVIEAPALLEQRHPLKPSLLCQASEKLTGQIQEVLETGRYTASEIRRMVFERASTVYKAAVIDDIDYQTEKLKAAIWEREMQTDFDETLFLQTVRRIVFNPDGRLQFELLNGLNLDINIGQNL